MRIESWPPIPDAEPVPKLDSKGRPVATVAGPVTLPADPVEQNRRETARTMARMACQVVDCFETAAPPDGAPLAAWLAYAADLQAELEAAGFVGGDIRAIITAMWEANQGAGDLGNG